MSVDNHLVVSMSHDRLVWMKPVSKTQVLIKDMSPLNDPLKSWPHGNIYLLSMAALVVIGITSLIP